MGASIGVDSHKGSLAAAAVDELGRVFGIKEFPNDPGGHRALIEFYVVAAPEAARGIYHTWAECKAAVHEVSGARFQSVDSLEKANAMLGDGVILTPGVYGFTDGNAAGGVGVVIIDQVPRRSDSSTRCRPGSGAFADAGIPGLESDEEVTEALGRLHNILAELAGLYHACSWLSRARRSRSRTTTRASACG